MPKTSTPAMELAKSQLRDLAGEVAVIRMTGQLHDANTAATLAELASDKLLAAVAGRGDSELHHKLMSFKRDADRLSEGIRDAMTKWSERQESVEEVSAEILATARRCLPEPAAV